MNNEELDDDVDDDISGQNPFTAFGEWDTHEDDEAYRTL